MKYEIIGGSAFPVIRVYLDAGESVKAESGAMVAMTSGLRLTGKADGGIGRAIARMFSGESFFMQNVEADQPGWVLLATAMPGAIADVQVQAGRELIVQKNGFLAGTSDIQVSTKVQSLTRGLLGGEGFMVVKISGSGTAFLSTYGSIYTVEVPAGETILIDNGHLVAWDAHLKYEITKGASSWISAATSGEGLACRFTGPGRVLIQTRSPWGLGAWLFPFLPIPKTPQR